MIQAVKLKDAAYYNSDMRDEIQKKLTNYDELMEKLKWHNIKEESPINWSYVEVRALSYIYSYYTCRFRKDDKSWEYSIIGNPSNTYERNMDYIFDGKVCDGFNQFGEEILINNDTESDFEYYWRYILDENGEIAKYTIPECFGA